MGEPLLAGPKEVLLVPISALKRGVGKAASARRAKAARQGACLMQTAYYLLCSAVSVSDCVSGSAPHAELCAGPSDGI